MVPSLFFFLIYPVAGFIGGIVIASLYNLVAGWVGGFQLTFEPVEENPQGHLRE
jgi:hypothetical protein